MEDVQKCELAIQILECLNEGSDVSTTVQKIIHAIRESFQIDSIAFKILDEEGRFQLYSQEGDLENPDISSIAEIIITTNDRIIGVMQFSVVDQGMLTQENINFFERIGSSIAVAINKEQEASLQHREMCFKSIQKLTGGIAHNFNNWMTVVTGYMQLLRLDEYIPAKFQEDLEAIKEALKGMTDLTLNLMEAGGNGVIADKYLIDFKAFIKDLEQELRDFVGDDIELSLLLADESFSVESNESKLKKILMNIVENAKDAIEGKGKITIEITEKYIQQDTIENGEKLKAGRYIRINVIDNGKGMSQETLSKAFEPFFTTKPAHMGKGLGLSAIYGLVRYYDGHIFITSEVGHGTTVEVLLPTV